MNDPKKKFKGLIYNRRTHIEMYCLVKINHMTGRGKSKKDTNFHYRVKEMF